jgi:methylthioribulose-1-phosphate dehydratase
MAPLDPASRQRISLEIVALSRAMYARGWALATSGNFSARLGEGAVIITASGQDKGDLDEDGLLCLDLEGRPLGAASPAARPSAETPLHLGLYRRFPGARAVIHVHAPAATTISAMIGGGGEVRLAHWEMLKALGGVTTHEHEEAVPVIDNDQDTTRLTARAGERLDALPGAHAYLVAGHGLTTWGRTVAEARRHVEALEHLFECELRRMTAQGGSR